MEIIAETMGDIEWTTRVPEDAIDLEAFRQWVLRQDDVVAVDSEGTGLEIFSTEFQVRLIQFGTTDEAWLIPVDNGVPYRNVATWALRTLPRMVAHNATFDGQVFDRHLGVPLEQFLPHCVDTRILSHLIDSRREHEGGTGHGLKALSAAYVDPGAEDGQKELAAEFRRTKTTWATVPLDNEVYRRYAAADVILAARLLPALEHECRQREVPVPLIEYEHRIARIGAIVERAGMPLDVAYTEKLVAELEEEQEHYAGIARRYGVTSVNAPRQVADALIGMGETLTEKTSTGQWSTSSEVLLPLADLDTQWHRIGAREPNPLADAVVRSKRAGKWATSYAKAMLEGRDAQNRVHPRINTMGARTARWAVSSPPLQQLPSSDWRIRRAIAAPEGYTIASSDFAQVELRVLAALAGAESIVAAINNGEDLHSFTTRLVFDIPANEEVPKDKRKLCKVISLGKAYAGGAKTLARQTGLPFDQVKAAVAKYDRALPAIARFARYLTQKAQQDGMTVRTPSGRTLRLDRDKSYAAIAYLCQSTARDILGQALCDIEDAGLLPYVIGVVHDEVLVCAPDDEVEDVIARVGECMSMPFFGVAIDSDPEVTGRTWGHGYGAP